MRPGKHANAPSLAPTLVWVGLVVVAGAIGYRAGQSHARAHAKTNREPSALAAAAPVPDRGSPRDGSWRATLKSAAVDRVTTRGWDAIHAQPDTADRDRQLADEIERLARSDAPHALALVASETNWRLRALLRDACVRGWASVAPDAATEWVLALKAGDRRGAAAAALAGAACHPDKAIGLATRLIAADPGLSSEYGHLAIDALARRGEFQTAATLATQLAPADASLVSAAYLEWGERDPDAAFAAWRALDDPTLRRNALQGAIDGWAASEPEQLAQRATFFTPDERRLALSAALSRWAERDPLAATAWIEANDPGQEADDGIATVSQQSTLADSSPETALRWAALIVDPVKRTTAEQSILSRWGARAPDAAQRYAESLGNPADRAAALAILTPAAR